jgi:surfeit locus 1 family protein
MLHEGVAGYHVLTPLKLGGSRRWLIVNRGWVTAGDRTQLPDVRVASEQRAVIGRLERLPRPGLRLGRALQSEPLASVTVAQFPTAAELGERLGEQFYDYQLLLEPNEPDGFVRTWSAPVLPPTRHLAYAGQWLVFALGALAAAVTILIKTSRLS